MVGCVSVECVREGFVKLPASRWPSCLWTACPPAPGEGVWRRVGLRSSRGGGEGVVLVEAASVKREVGFAFRNLAFSPSRYQCHPVFPPLCEKAPRRGEWPVGGVLVFVRVLTLGQDTSAGDEADEERKSLTENATDSQAFHPAQHTPHHTGHTKQERVRQRKGLSVQQQHFGACCRGAVVVFLAPSTSSSLPSLRPVLPTLLGHPRPRL